ncbi:hypothetical protein [Botrimarina sp.]|uniref:hypothetical protein n=1 Tax=Botrimarina sp. TaxID=2795802 RepID=UPI0032EE6F2C
MLTQSERRALGAFHDFLMTPHRMLCFSGQTLEQHSLALESLSEKQLLVRERRPGAYSLTPAGYSAMKAG